MGHGDVLIVSDTNFPSESVAGPRPAPADGEPDLGRGDARDPVGPAARYLRR
ncbi:MAG: hypothetical protein ACO3O6_10470 [Gemmobacter sp.]